MSTSNQRWLTLNGIATLLSVSEDHAVWLAKQGYLVVIWGDKSKKIKTARFLEPTPEYIDKLRLAEALYGRLHPLPKDITLAGLLTTNEIAQIMGWSDRYAQKFLLAKKLPNIKVGQYRLYTIATVRDMLWRKEGRKEAGRRAPFLIQDLVRFFLAHAAAEAEDIPTDAAFYEDEAVQRKLARIARMPSPGRELAMKDLWEKVALAKTVAASLA